MLWAGPGQWECRGCSRSGPPAEGALTPWNCQGSLTALSNLPLERAYLSPLPSKP